RIDLGRGIGAVVDELDTVEIGIATPPLAVLAPLEDNPVADLVGDELERAGADRIADPVRAGLVEAAMHDERRIVGEAGDDRYVGLGELQLDGVVVDLFAGAFAQLLGVRIDERAET